MDSVRHQLQILCRPLCKDLLPLRIGVDQEIAFFLRDAPVHRNVRVQVGAVGKVGARNLHIGVHRLEDDFAVRIVRADRGDNRLEIRLGVRKRLLRRLSPIERIGGVVHRELNEHRVGTLGHDLRLHIRKSSRRILAGEPRVYDRRESRPAPVEFAAKAIHPFVADRSKRSTIADNLLRMPGAEVFNKTSRALRCEGRRQDNCNRQKSLNHVAVFSQRQLLDYFQSNYSKTNQPTTGNTRKNHHEKCATS